MPFLRQLGFQIIGDGGYRGESQDVLRITKRHGISRGIIEITLKKHLNLLMHVCSHMPERAQIVILLLLDSLWNVHSQFCMISYFR